MKSYLRAIALVIMLNGLTAFAAEKEKPKTAAPTTKTTENSSRPSGKSQNKMGTRFGIGAFFSLADQINFDADTNFGSGSGNFATSSSFGLGLYFHKFNPGNIGFSGGLTYEFSRNIDSATAAGGTQYYSQKPTLTFTVLSANANYSLDNGAYFYLGVNQPFAKLEKGSANISEKIGYQFGAGYFISRDFTIDVQMRYLRFKGDYDDGTIIGTITDGKFDGLVLSASYFFK